MQSGSHESPLGPNIITFIYNGLEVLAVFSPLVHRSSWWKVAGCRAQTGLSQSVAPRHQERH
jgi:hypothetical protein